MSPLLSPVHCPGPTATVQAIHGPPKPLPSCDLQYKTRVFMLLRKETVWRKETARKRMLGPRAVSGRGAIHFCHVREETAPSAPGMSAPWLCQAYLWVNSGACVNR